MTAEMRFYDWGFIAGALMFVVGLVLLGWLVVEYLVTNFGVAGVGFVLLIAGSGTVLVSTLVWDYCEDEEEDRY